MTAVLRVRDLVIATGDEREPTILVHGVSFDLVKGEVLCIVGESGSGKSLTVLAIMGLLPEGVWVDSGTIEYDGVDLTTATDAELRRLRGKDISMVFQDPLTSLNPLRRVGAQVREAVRVHDRGVSRAGADARAIELLSSVGIANAATRSRNHPHQWSGGMRQRAVIAMAIAHDPAVIIADEPTTALDVTVQAQVMAVLADVRRRSDSSLILITHDLGLAAGVADSMHILWKGRTVESGSVFDIFEDAAHSYTKSLLASVLSPMSIRGAAKGVGATSTVAPPPAGTPWTLETVSPGHLSASERNTA